MPPKNLNRNLDQKKIQWIRRTQKKQKRRKQIRKILITQKKN
ncbi:hypothetical protein GDO81_006168 [Engystomops pustulosus]|uniref:Uncharacterized protein n=1 Tax=Engystomops pustulosus TaxID=76066 RepID=A0AAV7CW32_ENGPU|nr:hypothetical protein GDO81_006168 [Engystomops pustulosus]